MVGILTQGTYGSPETPPLKENNFKKLDVNRMINIKYIIKGGGFRGVGT
uniref:Uncharacterized protein n=1 Tax=viral metagenome TaxID=1070528 RepID=A0A6C0HT90_9ZZZZ